MNLLASIDRLDSLIVDQTKAPAAANLRNQLSTVREQVEALEAAYAALKNQHSVLKNTTEQRIAELEVKNEELVSENGKVKPKAPHLTANDLADDAIKILIYLFTEDKKFSTEFLAGHFKISIGMARHHIGVLLKRLLIYPESRVIVSSYVPPTEYWISQAGGDYLVYEKLVS